MLSGSTGWTGGGGEDTSEGGGVMDGGKCGHVAIWDLNERKLAGQIRDAHQGPVTGLRCLPGEPVLVTSSPDNTVKQVGRKLCTLSIVHKVLSSAECNNRLLCSARLVY